MSERAFVGVLLEVRYDGFLFSGFARQPTARTIQGELDGAVLTMDPKASRVRGTSRTDAKVHALSHPVAFDSSVEIPARGWVLGLNQQLPEPIAVRSARVIPVGFDPRGAALSKTYRYVIATSPVRDPFLEHRVWRLGERLNQNAMCQAGEDIVGEHDFRAFRTAADCRENTVRQLLRVEVRTAGSDATLVEVIVTGSGFLHKMVRIIVGSLVDIGRGKLPQSALQKALDSGQRSDLGVTAPAEGLYLDHVQLAEPDGAVAAQQDAWP